MKCLLIAEDDRNFGKVLQFELEDAGYEVMLVRDGVEAVLAVLDRPGYDFVLLDIRMPKLNGINALRIIKKISPSIHVITFSGDATREEMDETLHVGAIRCFSKPFNISAIKSEIEGPVFKHPEV